jgi:protein involved in polysaccharide export with SLBB domain
VLHLVLKKSKKSPLFDRLLLISFLTLALGSCATRHPAPVRDPLKPLSVTVNPYTLATLDEIRVKFRDGHTEEFTVGQDGSLALPDGSIPATGIKSDLVEKRVRSAIADVAEVKTHEFRANKITVLGEVFHQIHTDLGDGPMRLMDAIASANGFTPLADKRHVRLLRQNAGRTEVYEFDLREMLLGHGLAQNFLLQAGDVITIPRSFL